MSVMAVVVERHPGAEADVDGVLDVALGEGGIDWDLEPVVVAGAGAAECGGDEVDLGHAVAGGLDFELASGAERGEFCIADAGDADWEEEAAREVVVSADVVGEGAGSVQRERGDRGGFGSAGGDTLESQEERDAGGEREAGDARAAGDVGIAVAALLEVRGDGGQRGEGQDPDGENNGGAPGDFGQILCGREALGGEGDGH